MNLKKSWHCKVEYLYESPFKNSHFNIKSLNELLSLVCSILDGFFIWRWTWSESHFCVVAWQGESCIVGWRGQSYVLDWWGYCCVAGWQRKFLQGKHASKAAVRRRSMVVTIRKNCHRRRRIILSWLERRVPSSAFFFNWRKGGGNSWSISQTSLLPHDADWDLQKNLSSLAHIVQYITNFTKKKKL